MFTRTHSWRVLSKCVRVHAFIGTPWKHGCEGEWSACVGVARKHTLWLAFYGFVWLTYHHIVPLSHAHNHDAFQVNVCVCTLSLKRLGNVGVRENEARALEWYANSSKRPLWLAIRFPWLCVVNQPSHCTTFTRTHSRRVLTKCVRVNAFIGKPGCEVEWSEYVGMVWELRQTPFMACYSLSMALCS